MTFDEWYDEPASRIVVGDSVVARGIARAAYEAGARETEAQLGLYGERDRSRARVEALEAELKREIAAVELGNQTAERLLRERERDRRAHGAIVARVAELEGALRKILELARAADATHAAIRGYSCFPSEARQAFLDADCLLTLSLPAAAPSPTGSAAPCPCGSSPGAPHEDGCGLQGLEESPTGSALALAATGGKP